MSVSELVGTLRTEVVAAVSLLEEDVNLLCMCLRFVLWNLKQKDSKFSRDDYLWLADNIDRIKSLDEDTKRELMEMVTVDQYGR